jgi:molecular chaperone DnaK
MVSLINSGVILSKVGGGSSSLRSCLENALNKLKEAHKSQDVAQIDPAVTELNNAWTAASEELYKASQEQPGAQPGANDGDGAGDQQGPTGSGTENVTDAEFEEVK